MHVVVGHPRTDAVLADRLLELQRAAYRVEAELIGDDRIPALHEGLGDLLAADLGWLVCRDGDDDGDGDGDGAVLGTLGWAEEPGAVVVDRLVVDPAAHRRGAGTALVRALLDRARVRPVTVSTGRANAPARALYEGLGFAPVGDEEPVDGLWITRFARPPGR